MTRHPLALRLVLVFLALAPDADACTIGVFSPSVTSDHRSILWKNRDNDCPDQEMAYCAGPRFRFVTVIDVGDTKEAWAGVNEAGFAIVDANSLNLPGGADEDDDGQIMFAALGSCSTVEDFAQMLDSLNTAGRSTPVNFCAMDSTGAASIFEASDTFYARFDIADETLGFMVRANYSLSGGVFNRLGRNRFRRAMQLGINALAGDSINARFIIQRLARDLGQVGFYPYPLPFDSAVGDLPHGYLSTDSTICRFRTRSVQVIVGPQPGGSQRQAVLWTMLGPGEVALPIPVWVVAESMPELLNGPSRSALCDKALSIHECLHPDQGHIRAINSFRLAEMYDSFAPVESAIFAMVESCESVWGLAGPDPAQACSVTAAACRMVMKAYLRFEHYTHWSAAPTEPAPSDSDPQIMAGGSPVSAAPASIRVPVFDALGRRVAYAVVALDKPAEPPAGLRSGTYFMALAPGTRPVRLNVIH